MDDSQALRLELSSWRPVRDYLAQGAIQEAAGMIANRSDNQAVRQFLVCILTTRNPVCTRRPG